MRVGVAATIRNLPVHKLANKMGPEKCKTIVAAHQLSGSDYTSKVGTKLSCLAEEPEGSLLHFGRNSSEDLLRYILRVAERYLVKVFNPNTSCQNFDELRYNYYHHTKICELSQLPPTTASITLHILRAFFVTYQRLNCLNEKTVALDPLSYGYEIQHDLLIPQKVNILLPPIDEFVPSCHCVAY
ncbi:uncharacterized protein LOC117173605 [Belonocnema kinseyi]|uniref:uncharacterized protein LOC117173605 n=1 Tax=Belonocnema kinseyi TaxID=2817044 RepID=UPI00143CE810|nr:uncharacterized protein LOC117173605 [Belonocnema kinseyi]